MWRILKEYKKNTIKYVTYKLCQDEYESHIKAVLEKRKLKDIRGEHVQKLFTHMFFLIRKQKKWISWQHYSDKERKALGKLGAFYFLMILKKK